MQYLVVIEKEGDSFGAYVPDLPGCIAVGKTKSRVKKLIHEAIELHLDDMRLRGKRAPKSQTSFELVSVG